jgi:hypothetical protein
MADKILKLKIDVSKIDKSKLYKGEKGTYLDATFLFNEAADQYGNNGMIVQEISKEDREAGQKGAILGNGKEFKPKGAAQPAAKPAAKQSGYTPIENDDDLPF